MSFLCVFSDGLCYTIGSVEGQLSNIGVLMGKRLTIGAVIGNANSPHTRDIMNGIQNAADQFDLNVVYLLGVHMESTFSAYFENKVDYGFDYQYNVVYDYALLADCDALIISYGSICIFLDNLDKREFLNKFEDIPYVLLEDRDEAGIGSSLISNNYEGVSKIVEHLVSVHKYTKFAFLGGPAWNTDAIERRNAFEDVLLKHGIDLHESMFEMGDFSARVETQVRRLLDNNPGVQAIVCANDVMADTVYKECARRGLVVGKDIAVTGYDDWEMAANMTPPLTTVLQNGFDMGYSAVKKALDLIEKGVPEESYVPTSVRIRSSCGCKSAVRHHFPKTSEYFVSRDTYIDNITKGIVNKSVSSIANSEVREGFTDEVRPLIKDYVLAIHNKPQGYKIDKKRLVTRLSDIFNGPHGDYISYIDFGEAISSLLSDKIMEEECNSRVPMYMDILTTVQKVVQAHVSKTNRDEMGKYQNDTMFMPYISRDMMIHIEDEEAFYRSAMRMIACMGVNSAYLYLLEKPVIHRKGEPWKLPQYLELAAYQEKGEVVSYPPEERPLMSREKPMSYYIEHDGRYVMSIYDIFMGVTQYGVLVTETNPKNMLLMNLSSLQISSGISFREMYEAQQELQRQLEDMVEEIQEKNRVLGFISEYDQLTGCLNRRGYIEQAQTLLTENKGKKAVVLIGDLDHLKEINDTFGHAEGDFAIKASANILRMALGGETVVARIGGDEFIAIFCENDKDTSGPTLVDRIKKVNDDFTVASDKPYFVEISVGYHEFVCEDGMDLNMLMQEADKSLYRAKSHRRASVQKSKN